MANNQGKREVLIDLIEQYLRSVMDSHVAILVPKIWYKITVMVTLYPNCRYKERPNKLPPHLIHKQ